MRGAFVPGQQRPSFQPRKARSKGTPPNAEINVAQDALATHRGVAEYHADVISHLVRQKGLSAEHEVLSAMFPRYLAFSLAHSRSLFACPPCEALGRSSDLILQLAGAQGINQPIKNLLTLAGS